VNCRDVDDAVMAIRGAEAAQLPTEAQKHLRGCRRCHDLTVALDLSAFSDSSHQTTLAQIQRGMVVDLRPVRPLAPRRYFFAGFGGMFILVTAIGVYRLGALALAVMSPLQTGAMLGELAVCAGLLAWSLVDQMAPASRHRISPRVLSVVIVIALALTMAILFQVRNEQRFWAKSWWCFKTGSSLGLLAAAPFWILLRRGAVLSPRTTGAATGLLAGLAGTSTLQIHCPNLDVWHILVSHLGVAVVGGMAGFIVGMAVETFNKRSFQRRHRAVA
jgi:hypothetical protein